MPVDQRTGNAIPVTGCIKKPASLYLVLQYLQEGGYHEARHALEAESACYFDMEYFGSQLLLGNWDTVEGYLGGFMKVQDDRHSLKIYFNIRKQKLFEALDSGNKVLALDILSKDFKIFKDYQPDVCAELASLLTLDDLRENAKLAYHPDARSARKIMLAEVTKLLEANPSVSQVSALPRMQPGLLDFLVLNSYGPGSSKWLQWDTSIGLDLAPPSNPPPLTPSAAGPAPFGLGDAESANPQGVPPEVPPGVPLGVPPGVPPIFPAFPPPELVTAVPLMPHQQVRLEGSKAKSGAADSPSKGKGGGLAKRGREDEEGGAKGEAGLWTAPAEGSPAGPGADPGPSLALAALPSVPMWLLPSGAEPTALEFNPTRSDMVVIGHEDGSLALCNAVHGRKYADWPATGLAREAGRVTKVCWHNKGAFIGVGYERRVVQVLLVHEDSGRSVLFELEGHQGAVHWVVFLEESGNRLLSCSDDGFIKVWDFVLRQEVHRFALGSTGRVQSLCRLGRSGASFMLSFGVQGTVTMCLNEAAHLGASTSTQHHIPLCVTCIQASSAGDRVWCCGVGEDGSGKLLEWDLVKDRPVRRYSGLSPGPVGHQLLMDLADNRYLVVGVHHSVKFWHVDEVDPLRTVDCGGGLPQWPGVCLSRDGLVLAVMGRQLAVQILTAPSALLQEHSRGGASPAPGAGAARPPAAGPPPPAAALATPPAQGPAGSSPFAPTLQMQGLRMEPAAAPSPGGDDERLPPEGRGPAPHGPGALDTAEHPSPASVPGSAQRGRGRSRGRGRGRGGGRPKNTAKSAAAGSPGATTAPPGEVPAGQDVPGAATPPAADTPLGQEAKTSKNDSIPPRKVGRPRNPDKPIKISKKKQKLLDAAAAAGGGAQPPAAAAGAAAGPGDVPGGRPAASMAPSSAAAALPPARAAAAAPLPAKLTTAAAAPAASVAQSTPSLPLRAGAPGLKDIPVGPSLHLPPKLAPGNDFATPATDAGPAVASERSTVNVSPAGSLDSQGSRPEVAPAPERLVAAAAMEVTDLGKTSFTVDKLPLVSLEVQELVDSPQPPLVTAVTFTEHAGDCDTLLTLHAPGLHKVWKNTAEGPRLWNTEEHQSMCHPEPLSGDSQADQLSCLDVSSSKSLLLSAYASSVQMFDLASCKAKSPNRCKVPLAATVVLFMPHDENMFAVGMSSGDIHIYDTAQQEPAKVLRGHTKRVTSLKFCSASQMLMSASSDQSLRGWNVETGKQQPMQILPVCGQADPKAEGAAAGDMIYIELSNRQTDLLAITPFQMTLHNPITLAPIRGWAPDPHSPLRLCAAKYNCTDRIIFAGFRNGLILVFDSEQTSPMYKLEIQSSMLPGDLSCMATHPSKESVLAVGLRSGVVLKITVAVSGTSGVSRLRS